MPNEYYLLTVWRDVAPEVYGPFKTAEKRDQAVRKYRNDHEDDDGIYRLDMVNGRPKVFSFSDGYFEEEDRMAGLKV